MADAIDSIVAKIDAREKISAFDIDLLRKHCPIIATNICNNADISDTVVIIPDGRYFNVGFALDDYGGGAGPFGEWVPFATEVIPEQNIKTEWKNATVVRAKQKDQERQLEMLKVAYRYLRKLESLGVDFSTTILYDDAECDGFCVIDDIEVALSYTLSDFQLQQLQKD